jgi:hypothetical protein
VFQLKQALSSDFLRQLADSTVQGLARRDCFYDQFHCVNRHFVAEHFEELASLLVNSISELHPKTGQHPSRTFAQAWRVGRAFRPPRCVASACDVCLSHRLVAHCTICGRRPRVTGLVFPVGSPRTERRHGKRAPACCLDASQTCVLDLICPHSGHHSG